MTFIIPINSDLVALYNFIINISELAASFRKNLKK